MYKTGKHVKRFKKEAFSFGRFTNFPSIIHGTAKIVHKISKTKLQRAIAEALRSLNGYKMPLSLSVASHQGTYEGEASFEVGVADGLYFDYLNEKTFTTLIDSLESSEFFPILDVLIIVSYRYSKNGKRISLNFDHHFLRFIFKNGELNLYLSHFKGIRRMPLDELLMHIINVVQKRVEKSRLKTFRIDRLKTY